MCQWFSRCGTWSIGIRITWKPVRIRIQIFGPHSGLTESEILRMGPSRASLVVQWLRIHLPMQGTWVRALVREDPIRRGATKPVRHNY